MSHCVENRSMRFSLSTASSCSKSALRPHMIACLSVCPLRRNVDPLKRVKQYFICTVSLLPGRITEGRGFPDSYPVSPISRNPDLGCRHTLPDRPFPNWCFALVRKQHAAPHFSSTVCGSRPCSGLAGTE